MRKYSWTICSSNNCMDLKKARSICTSTPQPQLTLRLNTYPTSLYTEKCCRSLSHISFWHAQGQSWGVCGHFYPPVVTDLAKELRNDFRFTHKVRKLFAMILFGIYLKFSHRTSIGNSYLGTPTTLTQGSRKHANSRITPLHVLNLRRYSTVRTP